MNAVRIATANLIRRVRENRQIHVEKYDVALMEWRRQMGEGLEKAAHLLLAEAPLKADEPNLYDLMQEHQRPESHVEDYDAAIAMLEMHTEETIEVPEADFRQLVLDQWRWKQAWVASNAKYLG